MNTSTLPGVSPALLFLYPRPPSIFNDRVGPNPSGHVKPGTERRARRDRQVLFGTEGNDGLVSDELATRDAAAILLSRSVRR